MYKVIDYFDSLTLQPSKNFLRGHFWWTCFPFFFDNTRITRFFCNRPTELIDIEKFDPEKEVIDNENKTEKNEFLAITKYKLRPIVILSTSGDAYSDRSWKGGEYFLVAPIYSLRDDITNEYRCSPKFVWNVITYKYNSLFYIPESTTFNIHEGIIHFDRIIAMHQSWFIKQRPVSLSGEALICLDEWLRLFVFGKVKKKFSEDLMLYREMVGNDPQIRYDLFGKPDIFK